MKDRNGGPTARVRSKRLCPRRIDHLCPEWTSSRVDETSTKMGPGRTRSAVRSAGVIGDDPRTPAFSLNTDPTYAPGETPRACRRRRRDETPHPKTGRSPGACFSRQGRQDSEPIDTHGPSARRGKHSLHIDLRITVGSRVYAFGPGKQPAPTPLKQCSVGNPASSKTSPARGQSRGGSGRHR